VEHRYVRTQQRFHQAHVHRAAGGEAHGVFAAASGYGLPRQELALGARCLNAPPAHMRVAAAAPVGPDGRTAGTVEGATAAGLQPAANTASAGRVPRGLNAGGGEPNAPTHSAVEATVPGHHELGARRHRVILGRKSFCGPEWLTWPARVCWQVGNQVLLRHGGTWITRDARCVSPLKPAATGVLRGAAPPADPTLARPPAMSSAADYTDRAVDDLPNEEDL